MNDLNDAAKQVYRETMLSAGYYEHHGTWRKRGTKPGAGGTRPEEVRLTQQQMEEMVREAFAASDLASRLIHESIAAITQDDLVHTALNRRVETMRKELLGENPTEVEKLLVDRVVCCWLDVHEVGLRYAGERDLDRKIKSQRLLDGANRRYFAALKALTQIRKLAIPKQAAEPVAAPNSDASPGSAEPKNAAPASPSPAKAPAGRPRDWAEMPAALEGIIQQLRDRRDVLREGQGLAPQAREAESDVAYVNGEAPCPPG